MKNFIFKDSKIVNNVETKENIIDILDSDFIDKLKKIKGYNEIMIQNDYINLDQYAYEYYHDYNKWWMIGIFNNIIDPFEKVEGQKIIRIPYFIELEYLIAENIANRELK